MSAPDADRQAVWTIVGTLADGSTGITLHGSAEETTTAVSPPDLPSAIAALEARLHPRWVWNDTAMWHARLLAAGVRVSRCHDLRLTHTILRDTMLAATPELDTARAWEAPSEVAIEQERPALFDLGPATARLPSDLDAIAAEFTRQRAVLDAADGRLRLLVAAESAGALIAAELRAAGLPWDVPTHERILTEELGARTGSGGVPEKIAALGAEVRAALGDPALSLDSQQKLLRGLHRAGILVESTSKWELAEHTHPAVAPLLEYKRLTRLLSANGWAWLAEWVQDGRFRPLYVPGGVVTGRWASAGGGALQLPRQLRPAVRADPGWKLIVADVAQLEPRVLAAMSGDLAMADAARGTDLYAGLVDAGIVATRQEAKIAVLGAMYGSTTGEAGRLVPRLRTAFPRAMALVDGAAHTGAQGGVVATLLGRTSPKPGPEWDAVQAAAAEPGAGSVEENRARRWSGDRGRFTRNFVVQGTAAEWALTWLAEIRRRLVELGEATGAPAPRSGPVFAGRPHLAFFLHDEVILHVPAEFADDAAAIVHESAAAAGRLLFGSFPLDFRLDLHITDDAEK